MDRRLVVLLTGAPLLALCLVVALASRPSQGDAASPVAPVSSERDAVTALGRLEPASGVIALGGFSESRIAELYVAEGDLVEADQVLYHLESSAEREADLELAEARLELARSRLASETQLAEQAVESARTELRRVNEAEPVEIEAQQARVAFLVSRHEAEKRALERKRALGPSISREALDEQEALVEQAEKNLTAARAELRARDVAHEIAVLQAEAELERAQILLDRIATVYSIDETKAAVSQARTALEATRIRAPVAGQILKVLKRTGERLGSTPVLQMGSTSEMHVVAEVYETDIRFVKIGQEALVTNPTLAEPVSGEVVSIGFLVFKNDILDIDPLADVDSRVIEVRIRLEPSETISRLTNLEVDVEIPLHGSVGK